MDVSGDFALPFRLDWRQMVNSCFQKHHACVDYTDLYHAIPWVWRPSGLSQLGILPQSSQHIWACAMTWARYILAGEKHAAWGVKVGYIPTGPGPDDHHAQGDWVISRQQMGTSKPSVPVTAGLSMEIWGLGPRTLAFPWLLGFPWKMSESWSHHSWSSLEIYTYISLCTFPLWNGLTHVPFQGHFSNKRMHFVRTFFWSTMPFCKKRVFCWANHFVRANFLYKMNSGPIIS